MIIPRPYQQAAVDAVYEHLRTKDNNPCVVLPTGCGKAVILAMIASDVVQKWNGRVLILAHVKELLEQNAEKVKMFCPDLKIGIYSAGLKSRDTDEQVIVAGIQSVHNKACELGAFDIIMVDECFPAGTLIDTPRGQIPIEDLYVGQPVRHAMGVGNIEAISSRPTFKLIKLELSNGKTIECTPNHLFFTEHGWCKAESLAVGTNLFSKEDLSALWTGVSTSYLQESSWKSKELRGRIQMENANTVFTSMSERMVKKTERATTETAGVMANPGADCKQGMPLLRKDNSTEILQNRSNVGKGMESNTILLDILLKESRKSDVFERYSGKGIAEVETNRSQTEYARRERQTIDCSAESICGNTECRNRICGNNNPGTAAYGSCALLQTGHCDAGVADRDSTGRRFSSVNENPQNGQTDSGMAGRVRVVSITHLKLKSPRTVYNLQVEGHPSYFANGVLVHNCHLIAPEGDGMYRSFLKDMKIINPKVRVVGLTATPFRLKGGLICQPENILNEVCYEAGLKEMIQQGYLSPLVSRAGRSEANLDDLHIRGGEFIGDEIAAAMDQETLVNSACREIIDLTRDRKSVLIFTSSVDHCRHVAETIERLSGKECAIVTGDTPAGERAEILDRFKGKTVPADLFGTPKPPLKFLANVNVLTTGFDAVNTDCVVLLRPTNSAGLLIQMVGRGTRLSPDTGKQNCLVLDFGGNIIRHGPVDMISVTDKTPGKGEAPAKKCPSCLALIHAAYQECPECGYKFPPPQKSNITEHASRDGIISGETFYDDYAVQDVFYCVHEKRFAEPGTPRTMRIDYQVGLGEFRSELVCPEHTGYARDKFEKWWKNRAAYGCQIPGTAQEAVALANSGLLATPTTITVKTVAGEKFPRITKCIMGERPIMRAPGDDIGEADWPSNSPADLGVSQEELDEVPF